MIFNKTDLETSLSTLESFKEFKEEMLPPHITSEDLLSKLDFITPYLIIGHGSRVSGNSYSTKSEQDLDLVIVSLKVAFWTLDELYNEIRTVFEKSYEDEIDFSLVTPRGLISHINGKSSLGKSLSQGFTIIYQRDINEIK